ncbi:hypothetical protein TTRE_0000014901 [Trichuris trichiura]|uniref:Uncharacterized protein n=1 Tax=Trichuris trichiura TaxID=36087 RepID=A0A077YZT6_TRITR|nr:hypothetical protein TTRE_0000014901 [Trichuris trichiura]
MDKVVVYCSKIHNGCTFQLLFRERSSKHESLCKEKKYCSSEEEEEEENTIDHSILHTAADEAGAPSCGSTMISSLERSLELSAILSDGLSDKECQVRQVKNSILGHRRTFSVILPYFELSK